MVAFHSEDVLGACLDALAAHAPEVNPVIVVDNSSSGATAELVRSKRVELIHPGRNLGFSGGANLGFRRAIDAGADTVLLLNPDVQLASGIGRLVEMTREAGIACGRLTGADGQTQAGFTFRRLPTPAVLAMELLGIHRLWPSNPWNQRYRCLDYNLNTEGYVEQPAGAFLMIRTDVWKMLGGMDEHFHPIWFEDVDFCKRALDAGYTIRYTPIVTAQHLGGHSIAQLADSSKQVYWYDSLLRYAAKHFRPWSYRTITGAAFISVIPRMVLGLIRERNRNSITVSIRILNSVGRRLVSTARPTQRLGRDTTT